MNKLPRKILEYADNCAYGDKFSVSAGDYTRVYLKDREGKVHDKTFFYDGSHYSKPNKKDSLYKELRSIMCQEIVGDVIRFSYPHTSEIASYSLDYMQNRIIADLPLEDGFIESILHACDDCPYDQVTEFPNTPIPSRFLKSV